MESVEVRLRDDEMSLGQGGTDGAAAGFVGPLAV